MLFFKAERGQASQGFAWEVMIGRHLLQGHLPALGEAVLAQNRLCAGLGNWDFHYTVGEVSTKEIGGSMPRLLSGWGPVWDCWTSPLQVAPGWYGVTPVPGPPNPQSRALPLWVDYLEIMSNMVSGGDGEIWTFPTFRILTGALPYPI